MEHRKRPVVLIETTGIFFKRIKGLYYTHIFLFSLYKFIYLHSVKLPKKNIIKD